MSIQCPNSNQIPHDDIVFTLRLDMWSSCAKCFLTCHSRRCRELSPGWWRAAIPDSVCSWSPLSYGRWWTCQQNNRHKATEGRAHLYCSHCLCEDDRTSLICSFFRNATKCFACCYVCFIGYLLERIWRAWQNCRSGFIATNISPRLSRGMRQ